MDYIIKPAPSVAVPVVGSDLHFPVNNLYCVGRNYADHAVEMGGDPNREPPFFFMKPAFAVVTDGDVPFPAETDDLHHEVELVVAIGEGGSIFGFAVGVDMTRRDLQAIAKEGRRPWEAGKVFEGAAPMGAITPIAESAEFDDAAISLSVNGDLKQSGNTNQMIWKIPEVIERLQQLFVLQPGDLIFTGTPAGVGAVQPGDKLEASVEGLAPLSFTLSRLHWVHHD